MRKSFAESPSPKAEMPYLLQLCMYESRTSVSYKLLYKLVLVQWQLGVGCAGGFAWPDAACGIARVAGAEVRALKSSAASRDASCTARVEL